MSDCIEYEKYFFDYIDGVISVDKRIGYEEHLGRCEFCTARNKEQRIYANAVEDFKLQYAVKDETVLRMDSRMAAFKNEMRKDAVLDQLGLISVAELVSIFELDGIVERKLIENENVLRIKGEFYIKKENISGLLTAIFKNAGDEKKSNMPDLFRVDGLDRLLINEYLLASYIK